MATELRYHETFREGTNPFSREFIRKLNIMAGEVSAFMDMREALEMRLAIPLKHPRRGGGLGGDMLLCVIDATQPPPPSFNATYDVHLASDPNITLTGATPLFRPVDPVEQLVPSAPPFSGDPGVDDPSNSLGLMAALGPSLEHSGVTHELVMVFAEFAASLPCPPPP